ncbi:hypothetical protein AAFC00_000964 [Neodothiora populina]|uniref:Peptidase A1 domain-containing protein n=1 Tax=Neodothiora populina TaxID=2781224 RepID=A0ABR3PMM3_9PEZI
MVSQKLTRVKLIHNPNYVRNGTKSYVSLLKKYNFAPTLNGPYFCQNVVHQTGKPVLMNKFATAVGGKAHVKHQVLLKKDPSSGQTGQVPAEDQQNDSEYLCQVGLGTPVQTLTLDFDTGSSDLWVWSSKLSESIQSRGKKAGHSIFDPSKSSTWKASSGSTWQISYGDSSSASGTVGFDTVNIGGLVIKNQGIEIADQMSSQFTSGPGDGLLGLAWGSINTVQPEPVKTPVENMISQDDIPKESELFTACLSGYKDSGEESFYTFGFIDQDLLTAAGLSGNSDIKWADVDNSQGFWSVSSTSATVGGSTVDRSGNTSIMDTGTTLCLVDDNFLKQIYDAIPGSKYDDTQQGYVFPSSTSASDLPVVTVAIGNNQFTINKEDLAFADAGNGMVYGGIQSRGSMDFDIYGDVVLKSIYAIFDQGNTRFGAVQRASST